MTYALALGCIYRSKGGMALQATVSHVSHSLLAVAEVSTGLTCLWLTHALTLVAIAAGLTFIPHVTVKHCPLKSWPLKQGLVLACSCTPFSSLNVKMPSVYNVEEGKVVL